MNQNSVNLLNWILNIIPIAAHNFGLIFDFLFYKKYFMMKNSYLNRVWSRHKNIWKILLIKLHRNVYFPVYFYTFESYFYELFGCSHFWDIPNLLRHFYGRIFIKDETFHSGSWIVYHVSRITQTKENLLCH